MLAAVTLILTLCKDTRQSQDSKSTHDGIDRTVVLLRFRKKVPELIKITRALLHGAYSAEHDVGGQHDPFLQVTLLTLLVALREGCPETSDHISDTLATGSSNTRVCKNARHALPYAPLSTLDPADTVWG